MAEKQLKWTLDMDTANLTCKHKESQTKEKFNIPDLFCSVVWDILDNVQKQALAYGCQQKLRDLVAGKGKKAGYSGAEIFALMRNKWQSLTVDRTWSQKSGERVSIQKKMADVKVMSESMKTFALSIGLKIDPATAILSDGEYADYLETRED